jgi:hypothetical protein
MKLSGHEMGELMQVTVDAFTEGDLRCFVRTELERDLGDDVGEAEGKRNAAFKLIDRINREGRAMDLVIALRKNRPRVPEVTELCDRLLARVGQQPPRSPEELRKEIDEFHRQFLDCRELFRFLNACKGLHDILHDLQSFRPQLEAAVAARPAAPDRPLAEDVVLALRGWLDTARQNAREREFPEDPPPWIARYATAVERLTGPDPARLDQALLRVVSLPAKELPGLNRELIDHARRLHAPQLIALMDRVLVAMGTAATPEAEKLVSAITSFRASCSKLVGLIHVHDLCQGVANVLQEAAGLPEVTADRLSNWDEAKDLLEQLSKSQRGNFRVVRTLEAARKFEAAADRAAVAAAFKSLLECFDDLFLKTDKVLHNVTNQLLTSALRLQDALEAFQ